MKDLPPEPEKDRSERWLLTYADLITLLLVFFIILYVMSTQDAAKFKGVAQSLNVAFQGTRYIVGESPGASMIPGAGSREREEGTDEKTPAHPSGRAPRAETKTLASIQEQVQALAKEEGLDASISVAVGERGVVIRIVNKLLFNSGYAELNAEAKSVMEKIGKIVKQNKDQYVRIEGHTDNIPISNTQFGSNWELSSARATNLVRMLISDVELDAQLLSAVGYAEFRPLSDNSTEAGRAKNRRVEIVILNSRFSPSESPSAQH